LKTQQGSSTALQKWLYTYELPRSAMNELSVRRFEVADKTWLQFMSDNRRNAAPIHDYDVIIGPMANDRTNAAIQLYFSGGYGQVETNRAMEILFEVLMPDNLPPQTFFATERAVSLLKHVGKERI
jgi:hypothetical protein